MQHIEIWIEAFSGLGLFLFGMLYLEEQIKISAGRAFKQIVQSATNTQIKSLFTGIIATSIFQSSSVVTLMALSLVGAQLMSLESSIAIIMGSNIGTTVTAWIVGFIGFSMNIKLLSYAVIGMGGLGQVLSSDTTKWKHYFGMMVGFGLIFLGLEGMKESFSSISETFDIASYTFTNPYWYALLGLALTAVIQSSSASIAIAQSALYVNVISFEAAAAFVIGANVGTTITALLGSIGGTPDKKRVALAHLVFNITTALLALLLLTQLIFWVDTLFGEINEVLKIAIFHTVFNLIGVLLWYPFIPYLTAFTQRFFKRPHENITHYIANVSVEVPDIAIEALQKEIDHLSNKVIEFALLIINIPPPKILDENIAIDKILNKYNSNFDIEYDKLYAKISRLEGEIYSYTSELATKNSNETINIMINTQLNRVNYLSTAAKVIKDIHHDLNKFANATTNEEQEFYKNIRYQIIRTVKVFHKATNGDEESLQEMDEVYKKIVDSYEKNIQIINNFSKNHNIKSYTTTMAINDMHSIKSFSKALYKLLKLPTFENYKNKQ